MQTQSTSTNTISPPRIFCRVIQHKKKLSNCLSSNLILTTDIQFEPNSKNSDCPIVFNLAYKNKQNSKIESLKKDLERIKKLRKNMEIFSNPDSLNNSTTMLKKIANDTKSILHTENPHYQVKTTNNSIIDTHKIKKSARKFIRPFRKRSGSTTRSGEMIISNIAKNQRNSSQQQEITEEFTQNSKGMAKYIAITEKLKKDKDFIESPEYLNDDSYLPCTTKDCGCQAMNFDRKIPEKPLCLHLIKVNKSEKMRNNKPVFFKEEPEDYKNCVLPYIRRIKISMPHIK